ncbi:MAG: proton-conducting transporter membrane subunit [Candidatus Margulisiibacteriota bacterium]
MSYLLILIPFLALVIANLLPKSKRAEIVFWMGLVLFVAQAKISALYLFGLLPSTGLQGIESILGFHLVLDNLAAVLLFTLGLTGMAAVLVGRFTIKRGDDRFNFLNLLLLSLIGINGISMVKDLFTLYIFIEAVALASFILIMLYRDKASFEGALKYLILSVIATALMLSAVGLLLLSAGGTSFAELKMVLPGNWLARLGIVIYLCGLFIKAGLTPFHGWVPDAYAAAPTAVSVFLAGIVTKASGIFTLIRVLPLIGSQGAVQEVLLIVGTLSILVGALLALGQKDMKRMLAYSSISQMGYIVAALAVGTKLGVLAALFHFFNHAVFKSQLFANAAAVEEQVGTVDMDKMGGLAQKMPVTGITSAIASLSTAGIPPLSGFWSKLLIILALWLSGHYFYAVIAVLASVLTLGYFLYFQRSVFFGRVPEGLKDIKEAGLGLLLPVVALSAVTVGVGLLFPFFYKVLLR